MSFIDYAIVAAVAVAFVLAFTRLRRRGACASCSQASSCSSANKSAACAGCSLYAKASCPVAQGVDATAQKLGKNIKQ